MTALNERQRAALRVLLAHGATPQGRAALNTTLGGYVGNTLIALRRRGLVFYLPFHGWTLTKEGRAALATEGA